jgi:hypothetical protein
MMDPLQALLQPGPLNATLFPPNSRYHGVPTATLETTDGRSVVHLRRRLVPPPDRFIVLYEHTVTQNERLDGIAQRYFGDPELYWRICDANVAFRPDDLTEQIGRRLNITLPEGIPRGQRA